MLDSVSTLTYNFQKPLRKPIMHTSILATDSLSSRKVGQRDDVYSSRFPA